MPVDSADELCIEADTGGEREPPPVRAAERDPARPRRDEHPRGGGGIERHAERPSHHVRATAGKHSDHGVLAEPVQHLVEESVSTEGKDAVDTIEPARELGCVCGPLGQRHRQLDTGAQLALDGR